MRKNPSKAVALLAVENDGIFDGFINVFKTNVTGVEKPVYKIVLME